jgi:hypothetical protein
MTLTLRIPINIHQDDALDAGYFDVFIRSAIAHNE